MLLVTGCNFKSFGPTDYSGRWPVKWPPPHRAFIEIRSDSVYNQLLEEKPGSFMTHKGRWILRPAKSGPQVVLLDAHLWGPDGYPMSTKVDVPINVVRSWGRTTLLYDTKDTLHWMATTWRQFNCGTEVLNLQRDSTYTQFNSTPGDDTLRGRWMVDGKRVVFQGPIRICSSRKQMTADELEIAGDGSRTVLLWKGGEGGYERMR